MTTSSSIWIGDVAPPPPPAASFRGSELDGREADSKLSCSRGGKTKSSSS